MTIKQLKDKLSNYDQDIEIKIKIYVLNHNCNFIEDTIEKIETISFIDYLNADENIVYLETTYILSEEK